MPCTQTMISWITWWSDAIKPCLGHMRVIQSLLEHHIMHSLVLWDITMQLDYSTNICVWGWHINYRSQGPQCSFLHHYHLERAPCKPCNVGDCGGHIVGVPTSCNLPPSCQKCHPIYSINLQFLPRNPSLPTSFVQGTIEFLQHNAGCCDFLHFGLQLPDCWVSFAWWGHVRINQLKARNPMHCSQWHVNWGSWFNVVTPWSSHTMVSPLCNEPWSAPLTVKAAQPELTTQLMLIFQWLNDWVFEINQQVAHTGLVIVIHCRSIIQPLHDAT